VRLAVLENFVDVAGLRMNAIGPRRVVRVSGFHFITERIGDGYRGVETFPAPVIL